MNEIKKYQPVQADTSETNTSEIDTSKRKFLGAAAGMAGITLAPGIFLYDAQARPAEQAATDKVRWGMLVDISHCTDCSDCVDACNKENGIKKPENPRIDSQWIRKVRVEDKTTKHVQELPIMCQHCKHPPCVDVCPTGASMKRADGIVLVDRHRCIGCRYCMMACPYKARSFVHEELSDQKSYMPRGKGTVESCTFCIHRVDKSDNPLPACAEACKHKSIVFGDMNNPQSEISKRLRQHGGLQLRADLGLDLGVRYLGIS